MRSVIIKVYDRKGSTVLRRRVLEHLGVDEGDLIEVVLRDDGTALLVPVRGSLAKLTRVDREDEVLKERKRARYLDSL